nr:VRR-NUC domain-containing protein [Enterovibrio nigricans]
MRQADSSPILPYRCITISHDVMPILLLLYFGNARQNLSEFVVNDLGIYQYEKVPLNIKDRLFEKRSQLEAWLSLSTLAEEYWQTVESKQRERVREIVNKLPPLFEWPPLAQKRSRLINAIARDLERLGDTSIAEQLYVQSTMPPARERLARIALSRGEPEKAAKTVATMLNTPYNEDEKDVAERLVKQLAKKGVMTGSANVINTFKEETITLALTKRVELVCADYFVDQGWEVWFSENLVLNALFGLAFWDIIFLPKPGAFLNPFQRGPKDMYLPDFVKAREQEIFARLDALTHDLASILDTYDEKKGIANDWVHWEYIDKALLSAAISSLTPEQCVACFRRILFDPKTNRSGHPDLFMVKEGNCQFVEIKGPGDKLQHHQIRWLNFLNLHGIAANVLYVKQPTSHDA